MFGCKKRKSKKEEKDESEDEDDEGVEEEQEGEGDAADESNLGSATTTTALSDFQHSIESELRAPSKCLVVKDLMVCFSPDSVYGNRQAFLKGIMLTVTLLILPPLPLIYQQSIPFKKSINNVLLSASLLANNLLTASLLAASLLGARLLVANFLVANFTSQTMTLLLFCVSCRPRPSMLQLAAMSSGNHLCGSEGFFTMLRCWDEVVCTSPR